MAPTTPMPILFDYILDAETVMKRHVRNLDNYARMNSLSLNSADSCTRG